MDEIADLIRLLAESPLEEPPMTNPKQLIDRFKMEQVANEGVVQPGNVVPDAVPRPQEVVSGATVAPSMINPESVLNAQPKETQRSKGATADPRTGMPEVVRPVDVRTGTVDASPPAIPRRLAGDQQVVSMATAVGRTATPRILEAISGATAEAKRATIEATAMVTPRASATIVVPPAFPMDPKEAFMIVDDVELPPWQDPPQARTIRAAPMDPDNVQSSEDFVAKAYVNLEGNRTDIDRWHL